MGEVTGDRLPIARLHETTLREASLWFQGMDFRPPRMTHDATGAYQARLKADETDVVSSTNGNPHNSSLYLRMSSRPDLAAPSDPVDRLMASSGVHELVHAFTWAYPQFNRFADANSSDMLPRCGSTGTDRDASAWLGEGVPAAVQIRWLEHQTGRAYAHHYDDPSFASWLRYYDQPLHRPRLPNAYFYANQRERERAAARSWKCGYGTWNFWYAVGEMLSDDPKEQVEYLRYILASDGNVSDGGLDYVDQGLRDAAEAFDSPNRVDEGLYEIYPRFIAEVVDDERFYDEPVELALRGKSEVLWHDGVIDPAATTAFKVSVDVGGDLPPDEPARFIVTLSEQPNREDFHLIEGTTLHQRPALEDDPYRFEVAVRRDTTFFVRLANMAEVPSETERTPYAIRFELGRFFGEPVASSSGPVNVDIPPGFAVMSGSQDLLGCQATDDGGSAFDLITAEEAIADIRRAYAEADQDMETMIESLEDGELPIPGMSGAQRAAMERMIANDPQMQAMMEEARADAEAMQAEVAREAETEGAEAIAETRAQYEGRSRLLLSLAGTTNAGRPCQILVTATLRGEEGGAQDLELADPSGLGDTDPMAVGIDEVTPFAGDMLAAMSDPDRYEVCMMAPEDQEVESERRCPAVCTAGQLTLEEASQNHVQGTLRVDLIRTPEGQRDSEGCPIVEHETFMAHFNITSSNEGQDAEAFRGLSDDALRQLGFSEEMIDQLRQSDGRGLIR